MSGVETGPLRPSRHGSHESTRHTASPDKQEALYIINPVVRTLNIDFISDLLLYAGGCSARAN